MKTLFGALLLLCLFLTGCNPMQEDVIPDGELKGTSKLFVACFISPQDTALIAKVSESRPLSGDLINPSGEIPGAKVTLSDGKKSVDLIYNTKLKYHRANAKALAIVPGQTYYLTVKSPDGRQVTATCSVPKAVDIAKVSLDSMGNTSTKSYYVRFKWQDKADENNYYRSLGVLRLSYLTSNGTKQVLAKDSSYVKFQQVGSSSPETLYSDEGKNGQVLESNPGFLAPSSTVKVDATNFLNSVKSASVTVNLFQVDKNYYQYHYDLELHRQTMDNPLTEAVLISSNIDGGLGCFGAFNCTSMLVRIR